MPLSTLNLLFHESDDFLQSPFPQNHLVHFILNFHGTILYCAIRSIETQIEHLSASLTCAYETIYQSYYLLQTLAKLGATSALVALSKTESKNIRELICRVLNAICKFQELRGEVVQQVIIIKQL